MVVSPKDAVTVILLRHAAETGKGNFEALLALRSPRSRFVPDAYVFPGGCLDSEDCQPGMERFCAGMDGQKARALLTDMPSSEKALGIWVAGIRETFEEVGLLMAYRRDGSLISLDAEHLLRRFSAYRKRLQTGDITLKTILLQEDLTLAADRLHYFSHWITPELLPIRYDVRFFIAEAPENQIASHDGIELTKHIWITPRQALDEFNGNRLNLVVPTLVTLEELSAYHTMEEAIASARKKNILPILTVMAEEEEGIVEYMSDGRVFKHMPPSIL